MSRVNMTRLLSMFALLLYSIIGAAIFLALEMPEQKERWSRRDAAYEQTRSDIVQQLIGLINTTDVDVFLMPVDMLNNTDRWFNDSGAALFVHNVQVILDNFHGHIVEIDRCEAELSWDFANAMLYCWTVVTTIGYGHLCPSTAAGKIATMIYALARLRN